MEANPLVGAWRLVSYEGRTGDNVLYPLGEDATGYIMYTHDGYMSVSMMAGATLFTVTPSFTRAAA